jgi:hypothetical protein
MSDRLAGISAFYFVTSFAVFAQAQSPEIKMPSSIFSVRASIDSIGTINDSS